MADDRCGGACQAAGAGKGRAILADEMGLGKTVQGIAAALLMKEAVGIRTGILRPLPRDVEMKL